jgi:hypothetical protein
MAAAYTEKQTHNKNKEVKTRVEFQPMIIVSYALDIAASVIGFGKHTLGEIKNRRNSNIFEIKQEYYLDF